VPVTGFTGDIGEAVAITFAQSGWNVVGHYCSRGDKACELKARIGALRLRQTRARSTDQDARQRRRAPYNILVNTVRPGVIDTDFHRKFPKDMKKC